MGLFTFRNTPPTPAPPAAPRPAQVQRLDEARKAHAAKLAAPVSPVPAARDVIGGVLGTLIHTGALAPAKAEEVRDEAERLGRMPHELLIRKTVVPRSEVYAAIARQPKAEQERIALVLRTAAELPEWDQILNDEGGPLGGAQRDSAVLALASSSEIARANKDGKDKPCFVICTATSRNSQAYNALVARVIKNGYRARAVLLAGSDDVLNVAWSQWDERRGTKAASKGAASDVHTMFDTIASDAFRRGASDIHLTNTRGMGTVWFRIDGDLLRQPLDMPGERMQSLCEAIYNTLTETGSTRKGFSAREMQDGVIERTFDEGRVRFRYSGLPAAPNGFDSTLRIIPIDVQSRAKTMGELGYSADQVEIIDRAFGRSSGLILLCGTTGSGKSTTLANRLRQLAVDHPTKKIRTVEEPVEYIIDGAIQTPVTRTAEDESGENDGKKKQSSFQKALRQIMRADPDVLMVGEIRDYDTAELAINGVRSGHLLASTIHADGSPICYDRLAGLGVPRLDLAAVNLVAAFVYQRLVQTLCQHCKIPAKDLRHSSDSAIEPVMARLQKILKDGIVPGIVPEGDVLNGIFFRNPLGCEKCNKRGITGRTVCAEILRPTPNMLHAIAAGDSRELWRLWRGTISKTDPNDMTGRRAFEHGLWKMRNGLVSPAEIEAQFNYLDEPVFEDVI